MESNIETKKYSVIVPILMVTLFFAGLFGIITNSLSLANYNNNINLTTSNLAPGDFDEMPIQIPSGFSNFKLSITLTPIPFNLNSNIIAGLYVMKSQLPFQLNENQANITTVTNSSFFADNLIQSGFTSISKDFTIITSQSVIYLLVANPADSTKSITWNVNILATQIGTSSTQAGIIVKIVFSAICTFIFFLLIIFSFIEYLEPNSYHARFLNLKLERKLSEFANNSLTWELTVAVISLVAFPFGVGEALGPSVGPILFFSIAGLVIVIYTYSQRNKAVRQIKTLLMRNGEMTITDIEKNLGLDHRRIKRDLGYLISYKGFNASIEGDKVIYHGELVQNTPVNEPVVADTIQKVPKNKSEPVEVLPKCAYCGYQALIPNALFCSECGASMVATK